MSKYKMSYQKLSSEDPSKFDYEDISRNLKNLDKQLKIYQKCGGQAQFASKREIESIQHHLTEIFKRPRIIKDDKAKLLQLESQFKELNQKINIQSKGPENSYEIKPEENLEDFGINEKSSLAYKDSTELKHEELLERKENIENLQKDFIIVNDLFKDTAKLAKEQGVMLEEVDKNVNVAVAETGKGVSELHKADQYQQKAKRKLGCIFIIAAIVVAVLLAIVLGVVVF